MIRYSKKEGEGYFGMIITKMDYIMHIQVDWIRMKATWIRIIRGITIYMVNDLPNDYISSPNLSISKIKGM